MKDLALLYIGSFAPDQPKYHNAGSSTAGNLFQLNWLRALRRSSFPALDVLTYFPVASFPKYPRLFVRGQKVELEDGQVVRSLPHLNFGALKILTLGIAAAWRTFWWGIRNRQKRRVVICYNLNAPPGLPIAWVCRLLRMEWIPFLCDVNVPGEVVVDSFLKRIEFSMQKRLIPRADRLIVVNQALVHDFAPGHEAIRIEGGVREDLLRRFEAFEADTSKAFHIVFAGRLTELNGIDLLLEALSRTPREDLTVSIAGEGPWESKIRQAADRDPRIRFFGLISHEEVVELYRSASLLVNLRRTGGQNHRYVFPSKVVECLATGRPLLTTCTGHVREEYGDFVFTLESETPEALASAIEEIAAMSPQVREAKGKRAQDYVRCHKTWEGQARRFAAYLEGATSAEAA